MPEVFTHTCPCGASYTDTDPEVYLCATCKEQRKAVAKQVDAKLAGKVARNVKNDYQLYLELKQNSPIQRGGMKFVDFRNFP